VFRDLARDQRKPYIGSLEERPGHRLYLTAQDPRTGVATSGKSLQVDHTSSRSSNWKSIFKVRDGDTTGGTLEDNAGFLADRPLYMDKTSSGRHAICFFQEWEGEPDVNDERS